MESDANPPAEKSEEVDEQAQDEVQLPSELKTIDDIHKTFSTVIDQFRGDKSAAKFMEEYEKLYEALKRSHKELKGWQLKCSNLASEIKNNTEKVNLAIHLSQEDKGMIAALNKQVQEAWDMVETLHDRERKAKMAVTSMKEEIHVLTTLVEEGMGLDELQKLSEKFAGERKDLEDMISDLKEERDGAELRAKEALQRARERELYLEKTLTMEKNRVHKARNLLEIEKNRMEQSQQTVTRLERTKGRLESEKTKLETEVAGWKKRQKETEKQANDYKVESEQFRDSYTRAQLRGDGLKKQLDDLKSQYEKQSLRKMFMGQTIKEMQEQRRSLLDDLEFKDKELREKNKDLANCQTKSNLLNTKMTKKQKDLKSCEEECKTGHTEIKSLENSINVTEKELDRTSALLRQAMGNLDSSEKTNRSLSKQKDEAVSEVLDAAAMNNRLEQDLNRTFEKMKKVYEHMKNITEEKDRLSVHLNERFCEIGRLNGELQTKEIIAFMAHKTIADMESQNKTMRDNLNTALNQRDSSQNMLKKTECLNSELAELNMNITKQAKSLAEDVIHREKSIYQISEKLRKVKDELNETINNLISEQMESRKRKEEALGLQRDLRTVDKLLEHQKYKMNQQSIQMQEITSQRNILGAMCVSKKQEINMLKEKHEVLATLMNSGNRMYSERVKEMKLLYVQNADLWRQKNLIMRNVENTENLKSKLGLANQQLVAYQARCKAIEDQPPLSVHKWQHMKVQDASKFELILKTNHLVKRLIWKTSEVARLEGELIDKAQIVTNMKNLLAKAPGPEIYVQSRNDRQERDGMRRKLECALAEMNMVQWTAEEREEERDTLKKQLMEERKKRVKQSKQMEKTKTGFLPVITAAYHIQSK